MDKCPARGSWTECGVYVIHRALLRVLKQSLHAKRGMVRRGPRHQGRGPCDTRGVVRNLLLHTTSDMFGGGPRHSR
ncbi:hypothetical protein Plhal710r2_c040g0138981 [Plasmopara halstedii]